MPQLTALRERIRLSLWFLPGLFALGAAVLALALVAVDEALTQDPGAAFFMFGGTPEGARSAFSTRLTQLAQVMPMIGRVSCAVTTP